MPSASAALLLAPYSELLLPLPLVQRKSPGLEIVPTPASSGKSSLQNVSQGHPLPLENTIAAPQGCLLTIHPPSSLLYNNLPLFLQTVTYKVTSPKRVVVTAI